VEPPAFNETHLAQMLGYLNITGLEVALLLNFKEAKLRWKRVVRGQPRISQAPYCFYPCPSVPSVVNPFFWTGIF